MNCYNFLCNKPITEGVVVIVPNVGTLDPKTMKIKKICALVAVCEECVKKYRGEKYVRGSIKTLDTA